MRQTTARPLTTEEEDRLRQSPGDASARMVRRLLATLDQARKERDELGVIAQRAPSDQEREAWGIAASGFDKLSAMLTEEKSTALILADATREVAERNRALTAELEAERALRLSGDEANCALLRILDAVASRLSAEEAAEVARLAAKAVRG
jgi:hypothetical protein